MLKDLYFRLVPVFVVQIGVAMGKAKKTQVEVLLACFSLNKLFVEALIKIDPGPWGH